jgi:hypothetical protein
VGNSFLLLAQISANEVANVRKYSHQICIPNINPGTMMIALASQEMNSTVLKSVQYSLVNHMP